MASNLMGAEIKADQDRARAEDQQRERTGRAAGRDRRSIGNGGGR